MQMRIHANDGLAEEAVALLKEEGFIVETKKLSPEELLREMPKIDALLVRSATKVTRELIEAGTRDAGKLKVVGRGGVGTDNIDLKAAKECGVIVKFAPNGNTNATAELALGLMFAVARKIPMAHRTLMGGVWHKKRFNGNELEGKTLGVIGCGRIGQSLAAKARGIGMKVIGYDMCRWLQSNVEYTDTLEAVLRNADFISLHTGGKDVVIGEAQLAMMKPTAYLINASRGKNVSEQALYKALKEGIIAGAALDTYENEPKLEGDAFKSPLHELDNIVMSAHLGASTFNATRRTSLEVAEVVMNYLRRGDFSSSVNVGSTVEEESRKVYAMFITHEDKPGMFGKIATAFGEMGVNIRENNSREIDSRVQTVYTIHQMPTEEMRVRLQGIEGIYRVTY